MKKIATFAYPAVVALSLLASVAAHAAGEQTEAPATTTASGITRAQVQAELQQARADGSMKAWSSSYNPLQQAATTGQRTREEVRAEAIAANKAGYAHMNYGNDGSVFGLPVRQPAGDVYAARAQRNK